MNHHALEEKVEAVLEVTVEKGSEVKTSLIYASRINGNGSWRYIRSNGQKYRKTIWNPKQMAEKLAEEYDSRGKNGQVHYLWIPEKNHTLKDTIKSPTEKSVS